MSISGASIVSGGKTARKVFDFGRTYVVKPKGKHQATVVWLHGLGDNGSSWSQILETLPLPNIKWICPTAPTRPISAFGGFPSIAWFDFEDLTENGSDDLDGLDASAAHVANLLLTEPPNIKLGIGGFSMGAASSLYIATCSVLGKKSNRDLSLPNLATVVGLSGWLPCAKTLKSEILERDGNANPAASLPILLCHGTEDEIVRYEYGKMSSAGLKTAGFENVTFKTYTGLGHYTSTEETDDVCAWFTSKFELDG